MSTETLNDMITILEHFHYDFTLLDVSDIKNKEFKLYLFDNGYAVPKSCSELVRFVVFKATGTKMVVKNRELSVALESSNFDLSTYINSSNIVKISSGFNRFKPVFLALKKAHINNRSIVNKLSKLSKKHHVPMNRDVLSTITSLVHSDSAIEEAVQKVGNYRKISLLNALSVRLNSADYLFYRIRNGKGYVKEAVKFEKYQIVYLKNVYRIVMNSLVESLKLEPQTYKMTPGVDLALPTSEKSFVGHIPYGTKISAESDLMVGIYWENSWGAWDIDLSAMSAYGRIGWNSSYRDADATLVYSGDVTDALNGASEFLYAAKGFKHPQLVLSNVYRGNPNAKFKLIVAKEKSKNFNSGYMVNPNNVILEQELEHPSNQTVLGVMLEAVSPTFAIINTGLGALSVGGGKTDEARQALLTQIAHRVSVEDLLQEAGWTRDDDEGKVDLTVGNLAKDSLTQII